MLITADGRFLVMGDLIGRIHLWHLPSGRSAGTLVGTGNEVSGLANSTSGKLLASSHVGGTILLWELQDGALKGRLRYGRSAIRQVLMPDGGTVAAVAPERGRRPRVVGYVSGDVVTPPDGTLLAAGTLHGVPTWRLPAGVPTQASVKKLIIAMTDLYSDLRRARDPPSARRRAGRGAVLSIWRKNFRVISPASEPGVGG